MESLGLQIAWEGRALPGAEGRWLCCSCAGGAFGLTGPSLTAQGADELAELCQLR